MHDVLQLLHGVRSPVWDILCVCIHHNEANCFVVPWALYPVALLDFLALIRNKQRGRVFIIH